MLKYGLNFLKTPYVAHTLEVNEEEKLVVNFDEVDCTTFVEYVLALALSPVKNGTIDNADYARTLQSIRYRDGKIDGYTSRLHYIADWVNNGVRHGFMEDITAANSPDTVRLSLNFMSTHMRGAQQPHCIIIAQAACRNMRQIGKFADGIHAVFLLFRPFPGTGTYGPVL